ncbi:MAG: NrfD/PsrC family molybdoenzyme membrane anchor subunit, partial [Actinomycetota bacterium]
GRDLWLSPMLAVVLVAQAAAAGAAALAIVAVARDADDGLQRFLALSLLAAIAVIAASTAMEYSHATHGTRQARAAIRNLLRGPFATMFWWGAVVAGMIAPAALLAVSLATDGPAALLVAAAVLSLGGLFAAEHTFVKAGQSVPLS